MTSRPSNENFLAWFSGSVVVDSSGNPLVCYHATTKTFSAFKQRRGSHLGFHFGTASSANERLVSLRDRGDRRFGLPVPVKDDRPELGLIIPGESVLPVYLCIRRPLRMNDAGVWSSAKSITESNLGLGLPKSNMAELREALVEMGIDGIVYRNETEDPGSNSYIVFNSSQIKSALCNCGNYDPSDPDICR